MDCPLSTKYMYYDEIVDLDYDSDFSLDNVDLDEFFD